MAITAEQLNYNIEELVNKSRDPKASESEKKASMAEV